MGSKKVVRYQARRAVARDFRNREIYTEVPSSDKVASPSYAGFVVAVLFVFAIYGVARLTGI